MIYEKKKLLDNSSLTILNYKHAAHGSASLDAFFCPS